MALEVGLAVGGAFLSSTLNVIFDHLAPQGEWLKLFEKRKHDVGLFNKLRRTLLGLQAVLDDAENKQSSNQSVNEWLSELQDTMEDAENLLDEINYEALRGQVEAQYQTSPPQQVMISDQFLDEIMPRVERTLETLKDLQGQIGDLGLLKYTRSSKQETPKRLPTTSVVDDSGVYGRKDETERLVNRLLLPVDEDGEKPNVIPIVGLGGVGKTTLAKVVYNDPRVQGHFDLKAWVCVSDQYNVFKIIKALLGESSTASDNLDEIQIKLKERVKGKKFLFVLDDIWSENYVDWADLKSLFVQGELGSKIIVTTRKDSVASMMGTDQPMVLKILPSDESWSLFERHAFKNKQLREHPEFQEVGKNIAHKCKGLPLALKAVAGLLRSKPGLEDWRNVLRSGIWEQSVSGVLPALHLSYHDLPRHLKRCFAYLAVFPKDFPCDREYVVQLWIADGLLQQPQTYETIENIGKQYFLELQSRSLIEKEAEKFMMHDLVNDLALLVSSKHCLRLEDLQGSHTSTHLLQRARHLSYTMGINDTFKKLEVLCKMERLRALLSINLHSSYYNYLSKRVLQNILPRLASLRALSLSHYKIAELPDSIFNELNQLRFLDLSSTKLKKLPESTCKLYNLQTLFLSHCPCLVMLPSNIGNLVRLEYLDVQDTPLSQMELRRLRFVSVLLGAKFIIGECEGARIEELCDLHNLHGSFSISELQKVGDVEDAEKANLRDKKHIKELSLKWSGMDADDSQVERDILNKLCPSTRIRELNIDGFRGTKFPNWIGDQSFCELVKLSLENCNNCHSLPSLGQLPSLKSLSIIGMRGISTVTEEFYRHDQSSMNPFQSLVELAFYDMPEWKEWHVLGNGNFPKLKCLSIRRCPQLIVNLPEKLCSLRKLNIENVCDCLNLGRFLIQNGLQKFKIWNCKNLQVAVVRPSLHELEIFECENLISFHQGESVAPDLKKIRLMHCHKLKSLPKHMRDLLPSLKDLWIYDCPELEYFPEGGLPLSLEHLSVLDCKSFVSCGKKWSLRELPNLVHIGGIVANESLELPSTIQKLCLSSARSLNNNALESLTSLQRLVICNIPEIQSLLGEGILLSLTSLQVLHIRESEQLQSLPEKGLPSSLSTLYIESCPQLQSLSEKGLPTSLSTLYIYHCYQLQSLPEKGLPSFLTTLYIESCPQLQSLPEKGLPFSLSSLLIGSCPKIQLFPENGLPSFISNLTIFGCPLLESHIEFEKGVDWPRVAHIPTLMIGEQHI